MGVIEIRNRSEKLGNFGAVREVDVRNGAELAFEGRARAARAAGERGREVGEMISAGGNLLLKGAELWDQYQERKSDEEADRYVARYQQGMNAYNRGYSAGDGRRVPGALEAEPEDTAKWLDDVTEHRDNFGAQLKGELKMSERGMEKARKRLLGYDLSMQNTWADRAAAVDRKRGDLAAAAREAASADALGTLPPEGAVNTDAARLVWQEWADAGENAAARAGLPPEAAAAAARKRALNVLQARLSARLSAAADAARGAATPEEAGKVFDRLQDALDGNTFGKDAPGGVVEALAPDARFTRTLKDGTEETAADYLREALGEDWDAWAFASAAREDVARAKRRAVSEAKAAKAEAARAAGEKAAADTDAFLKDNPPPETPEGAADAEAGLAEHFNRLADREDLPPAERLRYRKLSRAAAERSRAAAARLSDVARREREAARKQAYDDECAVLTIGRPDETADGGFRPFTAAETRDRADALFMAGRIDLTQYAALRARGGRKLDAEGKAFHRAAVGRIAAVLPKAVTDAFAYNPETNGIEARTVVREGKVKAAPEAATGMKAPSGEKILYGHMARMLDLSLDWMRRERKTVPEAMDFFTKLTQNEVNGYRRRTIEETLTEADGYITGRPLPDYGGAWGAPVADEGAPWSVLSGGGR